MSDRKKYRFCISTTLPWIPTKKVLIFQCARNENSKNWTRKNDTFQRAGWLERKISNTDLTRFLFQDWKRQKMPEICSHQIWLQKDHAILKSRNCNFKSKCDKGFSSQKIPSFYSNYYLSVFDFWFNVILNGPSKCEQKFTLKNAQISTILHTVSNLLFS